MAPAAGTAMVHVGQGSGGYEMKTDFQYVGHGKGEFNLAEKGETSRWLPVVLWGTVAVLAVILVSLIVVKTRGPGLVTSPTSSTTPPTIVKTSFLTSEDLISVAHAATKEEVKGPYKQFRVVLDHSQGKSLGFFLIQEFNSLYVKGLPFFGGLVTDWNEDNPDNAIRIGDRVVAVNGRSGPPEVMLDEIDKLRKLNLDMLRVTEGLLTNPRPIHGSYFSVVLDRTHGQDLGAFFTPAQDTLLIRGISGGMFDQWNKDNPNHQVHPGDRVVRVNSKEGDAQEMLAECNKHRVLIMNLTQGLASYKTQSTEERDDVWAWRDIMATATSTTSTDNVLVETITTTAFETVTSTTVELIEPGAGAAASASTRTSTSTTHTSTSAPLTTTTATTTTHTSTTTRTTTTTTENLGVMWVRGLMAEYWFDIGEHMQILPLSKEKIYALMTLRPDKVRIDPQVYYPLSLDGWPGIESNEFFAVRWTGELIIQDPGDYTFHFKSDDGSALTIDGTEVLGKREHPDWDQHMFQDEPEHTMFLTAGAHDVKIIFFNTVFHAGCIAMYKGPDTKGRLVTIPAYVLRSRVSDLPTDLLRDAVFLRKFAGRSGDERRPWLEGAGWNLAYGLVALLVASGSAYGAVVLGARCWRRRRQEDLRYASLRRILGEGSAADLES